jgi:hypothetical protein
MPGGEPKASWFIAAVNPLPGEMPQAICQKKQNHIKNQSSIVRAVVIITWR